MNGLHQMMPNSQICQNNVVWPLPPWPPGNAVVFPLPPAFNTYPGRVQWNTNENVRRTGSGLVHFFKQGSPNPKNSHSPPVNFSGVKGRRVHYRKFSNGGGGNRLTPPFVLRNTTSFIIRTRKSDSIISPAIFSATSPSPAILPEAFDEEAAKMKWGFNGYGSMKGLIRLRTRKCGSNELFGTGGVEMVYMNSGEEQNLDKRVDKQDSHIAQLEEENLTLKERMFLMERQLGELRKRVLSLENDGVAIHGNEGEAENFLAEQDVCSAKSVVNGASTSSNGSGDDDN